MWSYFMLEKLGRRMAIGLQLLLGGALFLVPLACPGRGAETFFLFLVRGLFTGAFQCNFVYTPEVYPTAIRATGLGMATSAARIGGFSVPYAAQVCVCVWGGGGGGWVRVRMCACVRVGARVWMCVRTRVCACVRVCACTCVAFAVIFCRASCVRRC